MGAAPAARVRLAPTIADLLLISGLLAAAVFSPLFFPRGGEGASVVVRAQGKVMTFPLHRDRVVRVEGARGLTWIEIKAGRAHILRSACSNQRWHHGQGWASTGGQSLVCVPNRVLVEVKGRERSAQASSQVDVVVR